ncbi:MAG: SCO family protein [Bacteroidales bacterium]|nr:SCO family protein [Bacteroidales bacterium]
MKILLILFLAAAPLFVNAQQFSDGSNLTREIDIGVVEKLGDTIPLDLTFFNEKNELVSLRQLIDRPTIMCFVYFDCPGLCSPLLSGVSDMVGKLTMELGKDYQIITISFNTSDTPEKALEKKRNFVQNISKENQDSWIYLTGTQESISAITAAAGYKYKPQGLDFAHPSVIMVLSPSGKITRYLYGLIYLPFDVKMAIIEAQKGIARPSINKVLEYCFAYNPTSKTYSLQVTRIFGSFILLAALAIFIPLIIRKKRRNKSTQ